MISTVWTSSSVGEHRHHQAEAQELVPAWAACRQASKTYLEEGCRAEEGHEVSISVPEAGAEATSISVIRTTSSQASSKVEEPEWAMMQIFSANSLRAVGVEEAERLGKIHGVGLA